MLRFHRLKVLRRLPHPGRGFTQGLLTEDGTVWESTGQYGQSSLRRYRLGQGEVEAAAALPSPGEFLLSGKGWRSLYHVRLIEGRRHKHPGRLLTPERSIQEPFRKA